MPRPGETNLDRLLASMQPVRVDGTFVFATLPPGHEPPAGLTPLLTFREREGLTLVLSEDDARAAGLEGQFRCALITLTVHSSLDAVGFLARITARLADAGIPVNAVSAFYHDHLFVPIARAEEAFAILRRLAAPTTPSAGVE